MKLSFEKVFYSVLSSFDLCFSPLNSLDKTSLVCVYVPIITLSSTMSLISEPPQIKIIF